MLGNREAEGETNLLGCQGVENPRNVFHGQEGDEESQLSENKGAECLRSKLGEQGDAVGGPVSVSLQDSNVNSTE